MEPGPRLRSQPVLDHLLRLLDHARHHSPGTAATTVLALDGPSGAGKSTLADELTGVLNHREPGTTALVRLEDMYPGWDGLEAGAGRLATEVLPFLRRGEPARYARWDWAADRYGPIRDEVPAKLVTIVEGVGSGALAAAPMVDVLIFVDAPDQVRYDRAMARDGEGYRPWWGRWAAQERAYFARDRPLERAALLVLPGTVQGPGLR